MNSVLLTASLFLFACTTSNASSVKQVGPSYESMLDQEDLSVAYLAAGCFWCVEAIFESVEGVEEVISGYSGGKASNAKYSKVAAGLTDHAEAVAVFYDADVIDYETILDVFFGSQDPTTPNQQGPDRGRQYRSSIFYKDATEQEIAEMNIRELDKAKVFDSRIVTEVVPLKAFYEAEAYHQNYEERNPNQPYILRISIPRLNAFKAKFPELLKEDAKQ